MKIECLTIQNDFVYPSERRSPRSLVPWRTCKFLQFEPSWRFDAWSAEKDSSELRKNAAFGNSFIGPSLRLLLYTSCVQQTQKVSVCTCSVYRDREIEFVCVKERVRVRVCFQSVCVSVCVLWDCESNVEIDRERECVCVCLCMCVVKWLREHVCVWMHIMEEWRRLLLCYSDFYFYSIL